jgi:capsular exopolysaccharide synthesis family protein
MSVLLGETPLHTAAQPVPGQPNLHLLASGPVPPNPAELLASERAKDIFTSAKSIFDVVLIDCPPVLPVTDAAILSSRADATLVVASAGETTGKEFSRTIELLSQVNAPIIGAVLNGVNATGGYGYGGYGYGYGRRYEPYVPDRELAAASSDA